MGLAGWLLKVRAHAQRTRIGDSPENIRAANSLLNPEILTIGFARRFATYKRANLIFRDLERLQTASAPAPAVATSLFDAHAGEQLAAVLSSWPMLRFCSAGGSVTAQSGSVHAPTKAFACRRLILPATGTTCRSTATRPWFIRW